MKLKHFLAIMAFIPASLVASVSYATGAIYGITAPASAYKGDPVQVTVTGSGSCEGGYTIYWGDTTNTAVTGNTSLPHNPPAHTYSTTGLKTISVDAGAGCSGGPTTQIQINNKPSGGYSGPYYPIKFSKITSISGYTKAFKGVTYKMKVKGNGKCKLRVKWGDGAIVNYSNYNLSAPTYLFHKYTTTGIRTIKVTPAPIIAYNTCSGSANKTVEVIKFDIGPRPEGGSLPRIKKYPGVQRR